MTQEQIKAKELVEKMYENQLLSVKLDKKVLAYELAKQCALIAVDEQIQFIENQMIGINYRIRKIFIDELEIVKQEILKL